MERNVRVAGPAPSPVHHLRRQDLVFAQLTETLSVPRPAAGTARTSRNVAIDYLRLLMTFGVVVTHANFLCWPKFAEAIFFVHMLVLNALICLGDAGPNLLALQCMAITLPLVAGVVWLDQRFKGVFL